MNTTKNEYILKTGKADVERLDALGAIYEDSTRAFLEFSGLEDGMNVADFGCGIGNTTRIIAEKIGKTGTVTGIDNAEKQLEVAISRNGDDRFQDVSFQKLDVYDLSHLENKFDFIFCRLLLINLKQPEAALKEMISTLKPNGIIAAEEFINPVENFCYPEVKEFTDHVKYMKEVHKIHGFEPEIGKRLKSMFIENKISNIRSKIFQPVLETETERSLPYLNVFVQETDLKLGFDKEEIAKKLKTLITDETYLISYYNVMQICGVKG